LEAENNQEDESRDLENYLLKLFIERRLLEDAPAKFSD
jgi:hypothetical protein